MTCFDELEQSIDGRHDRRVLTLRQHRMVDRILFLLLPAINGFLDIVKIRLEIAVHIPIVRPRHVVLLLAFTVLPLVSDFSLLPFFNDIENDKPIFKKYV